MLEMKSQCERCQAALPADLFGALICSYECTWCDSCAADLASTAVLGNCRASAGHYLRCVLFWGGLGVEEMPADLRGRSDHVLRKYAPILGLVVYLALIAVVGLIAMLTGAR